MRSEHHQVSSYTLRRGDVLRLEDVEGAMLHLAEGEVWITQTGDPRDVVLGAGESMLFDRAGVTVVGAFQAARLNVVEPVPAPSAGMRRTLRWLRRLGRTIAAPSLPAAPAAG